MVAAAGLRLFSRAGDYFEVRRVVISDYWP